MVFSNLTNQFLLLNMLTGGQWRASVSSCQSLANLVLLDINGDTSLRLTTSHKIQTHGGEGPGPKNRKHWGKSPKDRIVLGGEKIFLLLSKCYIFVNV